MQKPPPPDAVIYSLVPPAEFTVGEMPLIKAIGQRRSHRDFTPEPLNLEEISFLLWATQGVREVTGGGSWSRRVVPSAGARHPWETYLVIKNGAGLPPGLYRYLAMDHQLCYLCPPAELAARAIDDYWLLSDEALLFIWTAIPYRTEWRYGFLSAKMIAMEAGHICQNLYLASGAVGAGACAVGAFVQEEIDRLIDVDGEEEFAIYMARVGKITRHSDM